MNTNFAKEFPGRLLGLMEARGLTQQQLAGDITASQTSVSNWLRGGVPARRALKTLADYFGVTVEWLKTGQGPKLSTGAGNVRVEPAPSPSSVRWIPVISWASAGAAKDFTDMETFLDEKIPTQSKDPNAFALIVEGDSMEPKLSAGDRVTVSPNKEARSGDVVIARTRKDHSVYLKKFLRHGPHGNKVRLVSFNPDYPPLEFELSDFRFIYPVIGLFRQL